METSQDNSLNEGLLEVQRTLGWMDLVIGNINDAVYVTDIDGNLIFANQSFADMIESPRVFLLGQKIKEVFDVKYDHKATIDMGYLAPSADETIGIYTWKYKDKDCVFKISERVLPTTKQTVYLAQDISTEQELSNMKSIFINLASHQLRTPMTSIMLYSHLLNDMYSDLQDEKQKDLIDKIIKSSERMTKLINDILIITKFQNDKKSIGKIDEINFTELVHTIKREVSPKANERNLHLRFDMRDEITDFHSTSGSIQEILSNLIVNSIQYTPADGCIDVSISGTKESVTFKVIDTGIGIPENMLPLIFDQFSRADNAFEVHNEGTGLGLYLVKLLVTRLGGNITCESMIGKGTTFEVTLPSIQTAAIVHKTAT